MKKYLILLFIFHFQLLRAQELFPHNEPASSVPKGVLGVRMFSESYNEFGTERNMGALKLMYGLTPKLTLMATGTVSNHHSNYLPLDLITHTHSGNQTIYTTGSFPRGIIYPYRFNGINLYSKYRFYTNDGENKHFRMAAYGEYAYINVAHDETEPSLLDDNKGFGTGLISTYLYHHFATSLTSGIIIPGVYTETALDKYGGYSHNRLTYGKAIQYNLSFGYLLFPRKYTKYSETNINIYAEFMGKSYESAKVQQNGVHVEPQTELLKKGSYVEIHPGIQAIVHSNLRIDLSVGYPLINKSVAHFYPVYMIGIQRYFFL